MKQIFKNSIYYYMDLIYKECKKKCEPDKFEINEILFNIAKSELNKIKFNIIYVITQFFSLLFTFCINYSLFCAEILSLETNLYFALFVLFSVYLLILEIIKTLVNFCDKKHSHSKLNYINSISYNDFKRYLDNNNIKYVEKEL